MNPAGFAKNIFERLKSYASSERATLLSSSYPSSSSLFVLIDDDELVVRQWRSVSTRAGKTLITFRSAETFLTEKGSFPQDTVLFVDWYLDGSQTSEVFTRTLSKLGYKHIFIVTLVPSLNIQRFPWIKGVFDKTPPWSF